VKSCANKEDSTIEKPFQKHLEIEPKGKESLSQKDVPVGLETVSNDPTNKNSETESKVRNTDGKNIEGQVEDQVESEGRVEDQSVGECINDEVSSKSVGGHSDSDVESNSLSIDAYKSVDDNLNDESNVGEENEVSDTDVLPECDVSITMGGPKEVKELHKSLASTKPQICKNNQASQNVLNLPSDKNSQKTSPITHVVISDDILQARADDKKVNASPIQSVARPRNLRDILKAAGLNTNIVTNEPSLHKKKETEVAYPFLAEHDYAGLSVEPKTKVLYVMKDSGLKTVEQIPPNETATPVFKEPLPAQKVQAIVKKPVKSEEDIRIESSEYIFLFSLFFSLLAK